MIRHLALAACAVLPACHGSAPTPSPVTPPGPVVAAPVPPTGPSVPTEGGTLVGPFTHANLTVWLVCASNPAAPREFVTLDEGLRAGTVVVTERGGAAGQDDATVDTLEITNRSGKWLYVEAGEVVRGGKQDRTCGRDLLLAPDPTPQALPAFCVEQGRWTALDARGNGSGPTSQTAGVSFGAGGACVGQAAKVAILKEVSQAAVWEAVAMDRKANGSEQSASGTFCDVLDDAGVGRRAAPYIEALAALAERHPAAVGCVFALGSDVVAADRYAHPALFQRLYGKLLAAHARDAALKVKVGTACDPPPATAAAVEYLRQAADGQETEQAGMAGQALRICENGRTLAFESRRNDEFVHCAVVNK